MMKVVCRLQRSSNYNRPNPFTNSQKTLTKNKVTNLGRAIPIFRYLVYSFLKTFNKDLQGFQNLEGLEIEALKILRFI